ncbi:uncharacterized protein LOC658581 [Tribolium castaneum]|uniref:Uncharacterized protein n=1 Tax=Tribolium castaneum TaxID=7070 RepID=D6WK96_TRICA|nr:PREDICTED: uncharacterized protein LOC658581 [Tribolium castaneum]XP_008193245.1 PREDICTED: uncharacterized protein LOC658581 [Tribolium castaneum]XP_008193246.1 PREDICTED: uncharacterized protein LOC658581 [Tribolium castaneum]EFA03612.1 hypothetical protein TcasGA2_TC013700 [Tribolium castaneum]|eukprot:XP_008193242.1 PREDICTED: uncharacterized protein LOC658581 [Tribolium castaneum]
MPHRYSTAFSHLVLAGTGIYCLVQIKDAHFHCPHITFGLITVNSLIGLWRWGNPEYGDKAERLYSFTSYLQLLFALPCITTTEWLGYGYDRYLSWAWTILPTIPLVCYLVDASSDEKLEEAIIPINLIALGVVCFLAENYYGIAAAVSYAIDHYIVLKQGESLESIPAQDLYNYGLCFFAYFALRAIGD